MSSTPQWLSPTLKVFSIFAIVTGGLDASLGIGMFSGESAFSATKTVMAIVDSQVRFLGTTWAGYGVMLWWASNDLRARQVPLALLGGIMTFGGIGRLLSSLQHGFGAGWIRVAMWFELIFPGALYVFGRRKGFWL